MFGRYVFTTSAVPRSIDSDDLAYCGFAAEKLSNKMENVSGVVN